MELKNAQIFLLANFREQKSWYYTNGFFGEGDKKIVLFHRKDSFFRDEIYENRHSFLDMKLSKITFSLHFFIHWICLLIRRTCLWYKKMAHFLLVNFSYSDQKVQFGFVRIITMSWLFPRGLPQTAETKWKMYEKLEK